MDACGPSESQSNSPQPEPLLLRVPSACSSPSVFLHTRYLETVPGVRHTNGQGASNPGAPCSPFSPLGPFLPFFPFSPCGHKSFNKRQVLFGAGGIMAIQKKNGLANKCLEGHLPLFSGLGKA